MAKSLTSGQQSALNAAHHAECLFIEVDFTSGVQRYTTAGATMSWNSQTWVGGIDPRILAPIRETEQGEAVGLKVTLSGVPASQRAIALAEHIQGRRLSIWVAPMNISTYALEGTPVKEFEGLMDSPEFEDAEDGTCTITVDVESRMARMLHVSGWRYTDRDHQQRNPGDTICRWTSLLEKTVIWPTAEALRP